MGFPVANLSSYFTFAMLEHEMSPEQVREANTRAVMNVTVALKMSGRALLRRIVEARKLGSRSGEKER